MSTEHDLVVDIMRKTRIATLTYTDEAGRLVSTPMGTQDFTDPSQVHFITERDTDKVVAISARPQVNVAYSSSDGWVSLAGTAAVNDDRALLRELWDASAGIFMSGGPDDEQNTVLTVSTDTAQYWESPGKVATAVQLAKGLLTDGEPDLGDTGVVDL